jgi:hypothetical protein
MDDVLVDAIRDYGAHSRVPNLWIYADNDPVIRSALSNRMHAAYLDGGGDVKFVLFNRFGDVGNRVLGSARGEWMLQMDAFLRAHQLPTWRIDSVAELAKALDVDPREWKLGDGYLVGPGEKALAASTGPAKRMLGFGLGRPTLDEARKDAIDNCQKLAPQCAVMMENGHWLGASP